MPLNYETTRKDYADYNKYVGKRLLGFMPNARRWNYICLVGIICFALAFVVAFRLFGIGGSTITRLMFFFGLIVPSLLVLFVVGMGYRKAWINACVADNGLVLGSRSISLEPDGITTKTEFSQCKFAWEMIQAVEEDKEIIYLFIDNGFAIQVPKRAFPSENEMRAFMEKAREYIERH